METWRRRRRLARRLARYSTRTDVPLVGILGRAAVARAGAQHADRRPAASVAVNVFSNYAGTLWTAFMALAAVPVYVRLMGVEQYGLIGFFTSLAAVLALLDTSLDTVMNRELARLSIGGGRATEARDLVRSVEWVYWALALAIALAVGALAGVVADAWLHHSSLSRGFVQTSVVLMGVTIALQFPFVLYAGGLLGLQRQVALNIVLVATATLKAVGGILVLWLISPSVEAFLIWQAVVAAVQTIASAALLWRFLPSAPGHPRFRWPLLRRLLRFSASLGAIAVLAALLTQLPRLELSKLLSLRDFGYFSLATVVATGLYYLVIPVYQGVFPRFTQLVTTKDHDGLVRLYHRSSQLVSLAVLPVAAVITLFSRQVMLAWTRSPSIADHTQLVVALLLLGTMMHTMMWVPSALQLAHAWTKLSLYLNGVAAIILLPLTYVLAVHYGMTGGALSWIILNLGYLFIGIQMMHVHLLPKEKWRWYLQDLLPVGFAAFVGAGAVRLALESTSSSTSPWIALGWVVAALAGAEICGVLASPVARERLRVIFSTLPPAIRGSAVSVTR